MDFIIAIDADPLTTICSLLAQTWFCIDERLLPESTLDLSISERR